MEGRILAEFMGLSRLLHHRVHLVKEETGVFSGQNRVLLVLAHRGPVKQRTLAEDLRVRPSTVTVMLSGMEKAGLIKRTPSTEDKRAVVIDLTEKGREVSGRMAALMPVIEQDFLKGFSEEEKEALDGYLRRLQKNLAESILRNGGTLPTGDPRRKGEKTCFG